MKIQSRAILFAGLMMMPLWVSAVETLVPLKAQMFDLKQIRLLEGPFKEAQERDRKVLHDLEAERLLHSFRVTAGLPSTAQPLGGWEKPTSELRGHFVGHFLSACALMSASADDEKLKAKGDYIVAELAKCQAAMPERGYNKGFLSAYPESFFDRLDQRERVWAPYYTLHKIMAGLLDMYQLTGNQQALDVLLRMSDWLKFRIDRISSEQQQKILMAEHGGMMEILANLYSVTRNPEHLKLARAFNHEVIFDPLAKNEDQLNGRHANTQIPKIIGAARMYELTGDSRFGDIAKNFWKFVALDRSFCIGGNSDHEIFFEIEKFAKHLGSATAETCNTHNMLKLSRHLFSWKPSPVLIDFYERALYNHILASQDPESGMMLYFASLKPGHFKSYNTPEDSFWCCTGTGIENHAKYADTIFAHDAETLYVNLFIASELKWKEKGVDIRLETKFPESPSIRLTFQCAKPVKLNIMVRRPFWTTDPGYAEYDREWRNGDTLEVELPMSLRTEMLPRDPKTVALLYGPIVLAGELGTENLKKENLYIRGQLDSSTVPSPDVPVFRCKPSDLIQHIVPADSPLTFRTKGIGQPNDVKLSPYYKLHHQRHNIYWQSFGEDEWEQRKIELEKASVIRKDFEARMIDEVRTGEPQPETDHHLKSDRTRSGSYHGIAWRDALEGWFSYEVKVLPNHPVILRCTYWGKDTGGEFDILVDGVIITSKKKNGVKIDDFITEEYPIPAQLTQGKDRVTIKFQAGKKSTVNRVFGIHLLKAKTVD